MSSTTNGSTITESQILSNYLLLPASLRTIIPYSSSSGTTSTTNSSSTTITFLSLLPPSARSNSTTKALYAELQFQRNITIDNVRDSIERECSRALTVKAGLSRQLASELGSRHSRKRKRGVDENENNDRRDSQTSTSKEQVIDKDAEADIAMDAEIHDSNLGNLPQPMNMRNHTLPSLLQAMKSAVRDLEIEIAEIDDESDKILQEMEEVVGGLSDLRYGRFAARLSGDMDGKEKKGVEEEVVQGLKELRSVMERKTAPIVE